MQNLREKIKELTIKLPCSSEDIEWCLRVGLSEETICKMAAVGVMLDMPTVRHALVEGILNGKDLLSDIPVLFFRNHFQRIKRRRSEHTCQQGEIWS